jgi:hypothetical protein
MVWSALVVWKVLVTKLIKLAQCRSVIGVTLWAVF